LCDDRIISFGGTLEWYVAQLLAREFECASAHGLRIAHAAHGGDYDVIACTEGEVVYLETKSAPPRQIVQEEVGAFLDRIDTLRPDVALFLADTTLRMRDKLVPLFAAEAARRGLGWEATRLERELWRVGPEVYLLNADPDLRRNVGTCLAAGKRLAEALGDRAHHGALGGVRVAREGGEEVHRARDLGDRGARVAALARREPLAQMPLDLVHARGGGGAKDDLQLPHAREERFQRLGE